MRYLLYLSLWLACGSWCDAAGGQDSGVQTSFRVKYVAEGAVYLEGGRSAGLAEGQKLAVKRSGPNQTEEEIAELEVISVASASAVCEIKSSTQTVQSGDKAFLSARDVELLQIMRNSKESKKYPQVISFTEGDPLDAELREYVPRPPLPEVNRARGRVGFEYNTIRGVGSAQNTSTQLGFLLRADMTRLGGSYWNFSGYYRGRLNSRTSGLDTLTDLVNRTYHLTLSYDNPQSHWVAGFGRFYLPWASSLNTIDGGYIGRRIGKRVTAGIFGGSLPDPTSWNYSPDRQIAGSFVNVEGGSFENLRFTSTAGVAVSRVQWHPDRQFGFFENGLFYKRYFSVYSDVEADLLRGTSASNPDHMTISRSYSTVRFQPIPLISFDFSHNYFRNMPTFDQRLVSTGLLDNLLFQGMSGGVRLSLPYGISPYFNLGKSSQTGDTRTSWNHLYGLTLARLWRTGIRADVRYSNFASSFGSGRYQSLMLSRQIGERFRLDFQAGQQDIASSLTGATRTRWINTASDWMIGRHYFVGSGFTMYRGGIESYNQLYLNLGYRFDMK